MQKRKGFFITFISLSAISIFLLILSSLGLTKSISGVFENITVPIQKFTFEKFHKKDETIEIIRLKQENQKLMSQLVNYEEFKKENEALRLQFKNTDRPAKKIIPAAIIGASLNTLTIDKGSADSVQNDEVVVLGENLIGRIAKVSEHISLVEKLNSNNFSTTAKTLKTAATGVAKGDGSNIFLDSVILSEKLERGDTVLTKGDIDGSSKGYPPNLIIGKIESIDKKASNLFQSAGIKSMVDFDKLETVFVITSNN